MNYTEFTDEDRLAAAERDSAEDTESVKGDDATEVDDTTDEETVTDVADETGDYDDEETNPLIPIQYTDENGDLVMEEIAYKDLGTLVLKAKMKGEAPPQDENAKVLWDIYNDSDIIRQVIYYRSQGYTEKQIMDGLPQLWEQSKGKEPEFDDINDKIRYDIEKQVDHKIKPIQAKLQATETQLLEERIVANNEKTFHAALTKHGIEIAKMTAADTAAIKKSLYDIYPNANLKQMAFSAAQANVVVNDAFRSRQKVQKTGAQNAKNILRQSTAPQILSSRTSRDTGNRLAERLDGVSITDRAKKFNDVFG